MSASRLSAATPVSSSGRAHAWASTRIPGDYRDHHPRRIVGMDIRAYTPLASVRTDRQGEQRDLLLERAIEDLPDARIPILDVLFGPGAPDLASTTMSHSPMSLKKSGKPSTADPARFDWKPNSLGMSRFSTKVDAP